MSTFAMGNNRAGYKGETMAEMAESIELGLRQRYYKLINTLVDLIGRPAVDAWADKIELDGMTTTEAIREVERKLDQYECYCTPVNDPCLGCKRLAEAKGE